MTSIDLLDNSKCMIGARCEVCGDAGQLSVKTARLSHWVICLTTCVRCGKAKTIPALAGASLRRFVLDHCGHLGINVSQMEKESGRTP